MHAGHVHDLNGLHHAHFTSKSRRLFFQISPPRLFPSAHAHWPTDAELELEKTRVSCEDCIMAATRRLARVSGCFYGVNGGVGGWGGIHLKV